MEDGFYGDTGRVIGSFTKLSNGDRASTWWVTAMFDFVGDPVSRYTGGSGGMEDSVLSMLHRLRGFA